MLREERVPKESLGMSVPGLPDAPVAPRWNNFGDELELEPGFLDPDRELRPVRWFLLFD